MLSGLFVPNTFDYMIAGYVVLSVVLTIYIASIARRWKKAVAEYHLYQEEK
jgi:hypothetical protein